MKKESEVHTSQDHDRKFQHDHTEKNPRAAKDIPNSQDSNAYSAEKYAVTDKSSSGAVYIQDKRKLAREEHTAHFTNRESKAEE